MSRDILDKDINIVSLLFETFDTPSSSAIMAHIDQTGLVTDLYCGSRQHAMSCYISSLHDILSRSDHPAELLQVLCKRIDGQMTQSSATVSATMELTAPSTNHEPITMDAGQVTEVVDYLAYVRSFLDKHKEKDEAWLIAFSIEEKNFTSFYGDEEKLLDAFSLALFRFFANIRICPLCGKEISMECFLDHFKAFQFGY